ncbi:peroxisome targeting signal 1 receptor, putative [Trypanosoma cruzi marinkellei]|uniref:Peroxisome targeting signal 1 receptor, putative n=1 Tax=Trypanosoma cruzi marinkellei TaxID=85056 RepID=K2N6E3_TRYCR|nr:peroxisome targeting signal 1 receptor, putative [Trypanosoma cruzi marinkellei]
MRVGGVPPNVPRFSSCYLCVCVCVLPCLRLLGITFMKAAPKKNVSVLLGRASGAKRKRRPLPKADVGVAKKFGDPNAPMRAFFLSEGKLLQGLLCPPCLFMDACLFQRVGDASADDAGIFSAAPLRYAVIPGFFVHPSPSPFKQSAKSPRAARDAVCKASLRKFLKKAFDVARHAMGAVNDIPNDSLLIVAFAFTTGATADATKTRNRVCHFEGNRVSSANVAGGLRRWGEVVGLCVAHELSRAYRVRCELNCNIGVRPGSNEQVEERRELTGTREGDSWCVESSFCGVQFFWVAESHRRRGIGRAMVELARKNVSYGLEIPPEQVAFSEPTAHGTLFARRYAGRDDFLVF